MSNFHVALKKVVDDSYDVQYTVSCLLAQLILSHFLTLFTRNDTIS